MLSKEVMRDYWETAKLDELLDGMSRTVCMLRFTLSHPGLDTTIVGTSRWWRCWVRGRHCWSLGRWRNPMAPP